MRPRRVLVVDDDSSVRRMFCRRLSTEGFQTFPAASGVDALSRIQLLKPDLALIDIGMSGIDGVQVLKIMRSHPDTMSIPAILMTGMPIPEGALQAISDNLGSGPIFVKGDFNVLLRRINDSLARATPVPNNAAADHALRNGPLLLDLIRREVFVDGRHVPHLTAKRFDVLLALLRHGKPMTQEQLLAVVWANVGDLKAVQMAVARLRGDLKLFPTIQIKTAGRTYELIVLAAVPSPSR